ncbi:MAG: carbohydrate kinase [Chloroflexi bacterium HGW-Chloroflexi-5]|jgi:sugar/nucleoside kinase (ribokinase family)|nr:MAG: carbohydrate kinase [Chloroflexi bacterium HGW-Chloroflexi-5]
MKTFDIVFIGHMAIDEVRHFSGEVSVGAGSAVLCGALAAARVGRRVAVITRMAPADDHLVEPLREAGVDVMIIRAPVTTYMQVIHTSADVDIRRIIRKDSAGFFQPMDVPELQTGVLHLAGISDQEFNLDFIRDLKSRGLKLSADMQSFVRQGDPVSGEIVFSDVAAKREIVSLLDFVKLDIVEAEILTGTRDLEQAARQIASWGAGEVVITRSDGVLSLVDGVAYFSQFNNQSVIGRTGRGDTTFGAYLAWRPGHTIQDALDFAAALVSIKMESIGPFKGTLEDVLKRLKS